MSMIDIGKKVSFLRKKSGLTLSALSKSSGLSVSMISQVERNIITPSISTIMIFSKIFGVKPSYFLEEEMPDMLYIKKPDVSVFIRKIFSDELSGSVFLYEIEAGKKENKTITLSPYENLSEIFYCIKGDFRLSAGKKDIDVYEGDSLYFKTARKNFSLKSENGSKLVLIRFKNNV